MYIDAEIKLFKKKNKTLSNFIKITNKNKQIKISQKKISL
jgi:hypothetical protein